MPIRRATRYRKTLQHIIDECGGEGAYEAVEFLCGVVRGECSVEHLVRKPGPTEDFASASLIPLVETPPTIEERIQASKILLQYRHGLPKASLEVTTAEIGSRRVVYERLPTDKLRALEALLTEAEVEIEDGEIVKPKRRPQLDGDPE